MDLNLSDREYEPELEDNDGRIFASYDVSQREDMKMSDQNNLQNYDWVRTLSPTAGQIQNSHSSGRYQIGNLKDVNDVQRVYR